MKMIVMKQLFRAFLAILLIGAGPGATESVVSAQDGEAAQILSRLREKYNNINNLSLAFTSRTVFAVSRAEQETGGTLVIGKGNRYRIAIGERLIISDGKSVWSWSESNAQVIVDRFRDDPSGLTPERLLTHVPEDFRAVSTGTDMVGSKETVVLKLTPGLPGGQVKWLKLWVDEDEMEILKLQVLDLGENETSYVLKDISIDGDLPDSVFIFSAPPGTEELDLR